MVGLFAVLYKQLFLDADFKDAMQHFRISFDGNMIYLVAVLLLMILNWSIETIKWKWLIDKIHFISWMDAIEGILFGITFSMFTPSRVGEFGGRVFALDKDRIQAIVSTVIGSMAQLVVNISVGSLGFLAYVFVMQKTELHSFWVLAVMVALLVLLLHICFYNIDIVSSKFNKIKWLSSIIKYMDIIRLYSFSDLLTTEILSLFRNIIYTAQFIMLLYFFKLDIALVDALIISMSIFLFQTVNPFNIALIDFGFRGNVALFFLSGYTDNNLNILAATIMLWFVNLIIPAILGGISALRFKFFSE
jgi:uncharacterized membrane protein YbhN (UPF0104 family)